MEEKPNCYKCTYRGDIPRDAHSRCKHPLVVKEDNMNAAIKKLGIKGHPHGIKSGWFFWPANFDPVWLMSCNGFKEKRI